MSVAEMSEHHLEIISMHFRVFSESQDTEWRIFWGLLKVQIFILVLEILKNFLCGGGGGGGGEW